MRSRLVIAVSVLAAAAVPGALAHGGGIVDDALQSLRTGDPVFVHDHAIPTLETAEATALRERIAAAGGSIYIAVLPADAMHEAGSPIAVLDLVRNGLGVDGTYAVVVGGVFGAATRDGTLGSDAAALHANAALAAHGEGELAPMLLDFVDRLSAEPELGGDTSNGWLVQAIVGGLGLGTLVVLATLARARRRSSVG